MWTTLYPVNPVNVCEGLVVHGGDVLRVTGIGATADPGTHRWIVIDYKKQIEI